MEEDGQKEQVWPRQLELVGIEEHFAEVAQSVVVAVRLAVLVADDSPRGETARKFHQQLDI